MIKGRKGRKEGEREGERDGVCFVWDRRKHKKGKVLSNR